MRAPFTQLYVHLVWSTWDRLPMITQAIKEPLMATIVAKCRELRVEPLAVGLMPDHAHLLVRLPSTLAVATLVKEIKGVTSHMVTHTIAPDAPFKWQGGYGAFTLAKDDVPVVEVYINNQDRRHDKSGIVEEWETPDD